jgi:hypothetical protein
MDDLREQVELLESSANLSTSIEHVQRALDMLTAARAKIAAGRNSPVDRAIQLANQGATRSQDGALDPRQTPRPL